MGAWSWEVLNFSLLLFLDLPPASLLLLCFYNTGGEGARVIVVFEQILVEHFEGVILAVDLNGGEGALEEELLDEAEEEEEH